MWDIETVLKRSIKANKVVVIADACHSGGVGGQIARRSVDIRSNQINTYLIQLAQAKPTTAILTASEAGEASLESPEWGEHGVYTYFLLKGLNGEADTDKNGTVTLGEIIDYTGEQVRRATQNNQHPDTAGQFDRNLPMSAIR
jgi:uncharacterized caspase-like protein